MRENVEIKVLIKLKHRDIASKLSYINTLPNL